ncbi:hypothetical protein RchiOBHm_Chr1g0318521 [Rosa chinensis]|uniref:Uncharacterized protein n=1 Tax=Rosa chinensis TaxID=74649 RepID=A0A2P6S862_ROSCH|nr:hypothetical protein RchiOBHm_Chr1g0318521 [Rosa chinensis]
MTINRDFRIPRDKCLVWQRNKKEFERTGTLRRIYIKANPSSKLHLKRCNFEIEIPKNNHDASISRDFF